MSAHARPDLRILSRAPTDAVAEKLRRAGADKVISVVLGRMPAIRELLQQALAEG